VAKSQKRSKRFTTTAAASTQPKPDNESTAEASAKQQVSAQAFVAKGAAGQFSTKQWAMIYVAVFLVVQAVIVFAFVALGGEKREQRKMLSTAEVQFEEERFQESLDTLLEFGEQWPGAFGSREFQWKLGERYYALGQTQEAAEAYLKAVENDPTYWDMRALAGRALYESGQKDEAKSWFEEELEEGNKESDIAHYHLGLYALDEENYVEAFTRFQSISDKEAYQDKLLNARKVLEQKVIKPSEEAAKERLAELAS